MESLKLFSCCRSLRNNRTRIHKNLFVAMVIQVIIRLTLYLDQALIRSGPASGNGSFTGIDNTVSENIFFKKLMEGSILFTFFLLIAMPSSAVGR